MVPIIWEGTSGGAGGNITNVTFRDIIFHKTSLAVTIKSLPMMTGTAQDILYDGMVLDEVQHNAIMINSMNQNSVGAMNVFGVTIRNVTGSAGSAGKFDCAEGQCSGITLENVNIDTKVGYTCTVAMSMALQTVLVSPLHALSPDFL